MRITSEVTAFIDKEFKKPRRVTSLNIWSHQSLLSNALSNERCSSVRFSAYHLQLSTNNSCHTDSYFTCKVKEGRPCLWSFNSSKHFTEFTSYDDMGHSVTLHTLQSPKYHHKLSLIPRLDITERSSTMAKHNTSLLRITQPPPARFLDLFQSNPTLHIDQSFGGGFHFSFLFWILTWVSERIFSSTTCASNHSSASWLAHSITFEGIGVKPLNKSSFLDFHNDHKIQGQTLKEFGTTLRFFPKLSR